METKQSFRDYIQNGGYYRYDGRDPDPSAKRFTLAAGLATLILPWATYTIVDPNVGAIEAAEKTFTNVFFAYGGVAMLLSALVFGRGLFFVAAKSVVAILVPLGFAETALMHFDKIEPLYREVEALTYHRLGLLVLLGVYASFLYDLARNGGADIISRDIWRRDGPGEFEQAASPKKPKTKAPPAD